MEHILFGVEPDAGFVAVAGGIVVVAVGLWKIVRSWLLTKQTIKARESKAESDTKDEESDRNMKEFDYLLSENKRRLEMIEGKCERLSAMHLECQVEKAKLSVERDALHVEREWLRNEIARIKGNQS